MNRIVCILLLLTSGCSVARDAGVIYCEESKLNTEAIRTTGNCVLDAWPSRYPFFEPFEPQLKTETVDSLHLLNELALLDPNDRTDPDLARAVVRCAQVKYDFVKLGLERYLPEVLRYLP